MKRFDATSRAGFGLLASLCLAARLPPALAAPEIPPGDLARIQQAAPSEPPAKPAGARRLLVFSWRAGGYVHESIPWGAAALQILGEKTGAYAATLSADPAMFEQDQLFQFDAVAVNNCFCAGDPLPDPRHRQNLLEFVRSGRGLVGIHCAVLVDWPEYIEMLGGRSVDHPWNQGSTVTLKPEEPDHPLVRCFAGASFAHTDEIYRFDRFSRQHVRVLLSLDTDHTDMDKPGIAPGESDFPLSWIRSHGQGRVFYSALGHQHETYWQPVILKHYLAGIQFALGDLPADTTPSARLPGYRPPPHRPIGAAYRQVEKQALPDGWAFPALSFDGQAAHAVHAGDVDIANEATVAFWIRTPEPTNDRRLLSQLRGGAGQGGALWLDALQLEVWTPAGWLPLLNRGLASNQWVHVAIAFSKEGQATAYRNGRAQRTVPARFEFQGTDALIGGKFLGQWGNPYLGEMHDLRLLRHALSAGAIEQIRDGARPPGADTAVETPPDLWAELPQVGFTGSRSALVEVEELVRQSLGDAARRNELEQRFVALLRAPETTAAAKEFLGWQLRLIGSANAVPALAGLLGDAQLSHAARIALQENPAPEAGQALREALSTASGPLLVGLVNSVAARRDPQAVAALATLAGHEDPAVAGAAIAGLGRVGGVAAVDALGALWTRSGAAQQRPEVADASLRCADGLLAEGEADRALAIYRRIFDASNAPPAARLAAAVGLLTCRKQDAVDTVVQFLGGPDPALRDLAIRHLRSLPGEAVTLRLSAELGRLPVPVKVQLIHALAERSDAAATAMLLDAAGSDDPRTRLAALAGLARREGTSESVARLLDAAASQTDPEQTAARESLIRLRGSETDRILLAHVATGATAWRVEALRAVGQRGLAEGTPALWKAARDPEPAVRLAALRALGQVAGAAEYPALIDLLSEARDSQEREAAVRALESVAGRIDVPEERVRPLVDRLPQASVETTTALLPILATLGGSTALTTVESATRRKEAGIRDAAIRALAGWPDPSALNALRALIPSVTNLTQRTLAVSGFIRLIGQPGARPAPQVVADYRQALAWAATAEEKMRILAGLAELRHADALALAEECARDPALEAEATLAVQAIRKALGQAPGGKP